MIKALAFIKTEFIITLFTKQKIFGMTKTKKVTITLTDEQQEKARNLSVLVLGKENISGLIGYMINKLHMETEK